MPLSNNASKLLLEIKTKIPADTWFYASQINAHPSVIASLYRGGKLDRKFVLGSNCNLYRWIK